MPYLPKIPETPQSQIITNTFLGYNHNLKIGEGNNSGYPQSSLEFYDMKNMCSDFYPLLANRHKRSTVKTLSSPAGLIGKAALAYIDGSTIYYGSNDITSYFTAKGLAISSSAQMLPKQLVSMGAYIIILPDKLYINTENYSDCGKIDSSFATDAGNSIIYSLCKVDGTEYAEPIASSTEPSNPANGDLWIDTSDVKHILKQYNAVTAMWVQIPTVYVRISYPGIGTGFAEYDGVTISGCSAHDTGIEAQIEELNGNKVIYAKNENYIVVTGIIDQSYTQPTGTVSVMRSMPDLDYITEAENRLWGCKYGLVDGKTVNEIYCCALGDFKNWNRFMGISTDSYVASVGTDGPWTGAVTHNGYPIFFKENYLHKVYISSSGAHQIADAACRGVQRGCGKSLVVVNETLFYKGIGGVMAYDGSMPVSAGDKLGHDKYSDASAGALDDKYYVSMKDTNNNWHMFVLDTEKGLWHREDNTNAMCFARCGGELYYIDADSNKLIAVNGTEGDLEDLVEWSVTTGIIGYNTVEQKYVSRLNLRMLLPKGSKADMYIQYDSDNIWHHCGHMEGMGTRTFMLPVRPRRCDHFQFRIDGIGDVRVYSFAKILETGSDG